MSHTAHQCGKRSETCHRHVRSCKTQVLRSLFMTLFYLFLSAVPWIISASVCFAFSPRQSTFISPFPYFLSPAIWLWTHNANGNGGAAPLLRGVHRLFLAQIAVYRLFFIQCRIINNFILDLQWQNMTSVALQGSHTRRGELSFSEHAGSESSGFAVWLHCRSVS